MFTQNQTHANIETGDTAKKEKSNLSPTAQLVNGVMKEDIMPVLRDRKKGVSLADTANKIIREKLGPDHPELIEFSLACREVQSEIYKQAQQKGRNEKELAVISNYFAKLQNSVGSTNIPKESDLPTQPQSPEQNEALS